MNGRLAAAPESVKIGERTKTKFRMANKRRFKSQGETREIVTWVDVECWGPLAENVAEYCVKGQEVTVRGRLAIESWEDKEGNKRWSTKISGDDVIFGNKPREATEGATSSQGFSEAILKQAMESVGVLMSKGVTSEIAAAVTLEKINKS